jgi:cytochrome b6-f complex subunit 5
MGAAGFPSWKNGGTLHELAPENPSPSMIEPLLCGIVLGLIPVTLAGLFVAAWNQYRRGSALGG